MARPRNKPVEPVVVSSIPVDEVEETPAVEMPKVKEVKIIKV